MYHPDRGAGLDFVEGWFADLTNRQLRHAKYKSDPVETEIREFIAAHHAKCQMFV